MKNLFLTTAVSVFSLAASSQNIGINTTNPQASFDLKGNYRIGGSTRYMTFDTLTGHLHVRFGSTGIIPFSPSVFVGESSDHAYLSLLCNSAFESGIIFGNELSNVNGSVIYDNSSTPNGFQFRNNGNQIRMVLDNTGNLGIGVINPSRKLDVSGDIGLTGRFTLNGNNGISGQVVQSNGTGSVSWASPTNAQYNNTNMVTGTPIVVPPEQSDPVPIPGLGYSFSVPGNAKVLVSFSITANPEFCVGCSTSDAYLFIYSDGTLVKTFAQSCLNNTFNLISATYLISYGAGLHNIQIRASGTAHTINFGAYTDTMTIQVTPQ